MCGGICGIPNSGSSVPLQIKYVQLSAASFYCYFANPSIKLPFYFQPFYLPSADADLPLERPLRLQKNEIKG